MQRRKKVEKLSAMELGQKLVDNDSTIVRDAFYEMTTHVFANMADIPDYMKYDWLRETLGKKYTSAMETMNAIHVWQNSGVDYPYAVPLVYLVMTVDFSLEDKRRFVDRYNAGIKDYKDMESWMVTMKKGDEDGKA